jgi:hypothetical protein
MKITVSGYNRPHYLDRTLTAVKRMIGFSSSKVMVILDPCDKTPLCQEVCKSHGIEFAALSQHAGCNDAVFASMQYGFSMGDDFHLHLEDDTVPTRDALLWFSWARDQYRHDKSIFTVTGYQRESNGNLGECGLRRWFTPWGWGTWADRWHEMSAAWSHGKASTSWDVHLTTMVRGTRWEAFPTVSRIQNIGAENGTHVPSAEWHSVHHHVKVTADDIDGSVRDFAEKEPML